MKTLHIAPGLSAGGLIVQAVRSAGRHDKVLSWPDDLSCGPINSDDPAARATWWAPFHGDWKIEASLRAFWEHVRTTDDRIVVWFGRHSASELAFFSPGQIGLGVDPSTSSMSPDRYFRLAVRRTPPR